MRKHLCNSRGAPCGTRISLAVAALTVMVILAVGAGFHLAGISGTAKGLFGLAVVAALIVGPLVSVLVIRPLGLAHVTGPASLSVAGHPTGLVDDVTHLLNRRGITTALLEAMAQSQRYGTPLSIALLQLDEFQSEVDAGDEAANRLVEAAAHAMTSVVRLPDRIGRHDPAEFLLVMPHTRGSAAAKVADRLRHAAASVPGVLGPTGVLTVSAGVVEFGKGQDLEKLLSQARMALNEASSGGGNRTVRAKMVRRRKDPPVVSE